MTPVLFWHIPKTGGTTVLRACEYALGAGAVYRKTAGASQLENLLRRYRFVQTGSMFVPCNVECVNATLVRDPVERVISLYYYVLGDSRRALHAAARKLGLLRFVSMDDPEVSNWQVRHISGWGKSRGLSREQLINAMDRLHTFPLVGVTDAMGSFMSRLQSRLGVELSVGRERYHQRPRGSEIDPRVREVVVSRNQLDQKLYEEACALSSQ